MLQAFWLVIQDLFYFVLGQSVVPNVSAVQPALPARPLSTQIAPPQSPLLLTEVVEQTGAEEEAIAVDNAPLHSPIVMYVREPQGTARLVGPQLEFDGCVETVSYGTAVTVVGYRGRYASILRAGHTGWIAKDALTPDKSAVWPQFRDKRQYLATDEDTLKVRALLADIFLAGALMLPLQAAEYILVRLQSDHRHIVWPDVRPRVPGSWQQILRGVRGIHNGITPKTDSIMEWMSDDGVGRLVYVEAVSPDNTIAYSGVGLHEAGHYESGVFTEAEWRELRPVFIEVL